MKNKPLVSRPDWNAYFMKMALLVAERSTCQRHHVGAVIVRDRRILTTGYNGAASGIKDCLALGCLRDQMKIPSGHRHEICRAIHAEQNAIIQAGLHGITIKKATIYCTHSPCILCAKMLVNAGISEFIMSTDYADPSYKALFRAAGIRYKKITQPPLTISTLA